MSRQGFTLLELLLALSAFSVAGVALAASLRTGYQAWTAGEASGRAMQEARRNLEDLGVELRNSIDVPGRAFKGGSEHLSFDTREGGTSPTLARLAYGPDPSLGVLVRRSEPYGGAPRSRVLSSNRAALSFAYPYRDPDMESVAWRDQWPGPERPRAVRVALTLVDARGAPHEFVKVAWVPGGVWKKLGEEEAR